MAKKLLIGIIGLTCVCFAATKPVSAAITNSAHDFSGDGWNASGQKCIVCHTPHSSSSTTSAPLWNHTLSTATYTPYSSPSLTATVGDPSSSSKACLSCHDGTVALDSFGGATGSNYLTGPDNLTNNLSNDHPVSITYDTALASTDGSLFDPATKTIENAGSLTGKTIAAGMLIGGKLECGSCHDVHNDKGYAPSSGKLLLVNNAGSGLCLTCHAK